MEFLIAFIGAVGLIAVVVIYNSLSWGFVCYKFYGWFVLPIFTQLPSIAFWQAVGLMFFISLFHNHSSIALKKEFEDSSQTITLAVISPWVLFIIGYFFR
jgi:hypothetical protein